MKRSGPPRRRAPLVADPEKQREWERRTRQRARQRDRDRLSSRVGDEHPRKHGVLAEDREYVKIRSHELCEANWPGVCQPGAHYGQHAHHMRLKGQGGADTHDNLLWVCFVVHRWIHDHPADAVERGLIRVR